MKAWAVQDAKARFSELLATCVQSGPQVVTYRGEEAAILVPMAEWKRLLANSKPGFKELLLLKEHCFEFELPKRGLRKRRAPMTFLEE